jgi:hypothetical protein
MSDFPQANIEANMARTCPNIVRANIALDTEHFGGYVLEEHPPMFGSGVRAEKEANNQNPAILQATSHVIVHGQPFPMRGGRP